MNVTAKIDALIGREGGFSNDPNDRGNWYLGKLEGTMWGVTAAEARANGYLGAMKDMPRATAVAIYASRYWSRPKFDQIDAISTTLAEKLFDIGVNAGPATGVKFMQRALNVLNQGGKAFPDIAADGGIGPMTLAALQAFLQQRGGGWPSCSVRHDRRAAIGVLHRAGRAPSGERDVRVWLAT